jgi:hypothetical protein
MVSVLWQPVLIYLLDQTLMLREELSEQKE